MSGKSLSPSKNMWKPSYIFNPVKQFKERAGKIKDDLSPDMPGEDPAARALRERQAQDEAELDEQENRKIKTLLTGARGTRAYRGGPLTRNAPSNSKPAIPRTAAGSGASGLGALNLRRGGLVRNLLQVRRALVDG